MNFMEMSEFSGKSQGIQEFSKNFDGLNTGEIRLKVYENYNS